jgi:hypothetical protein
VNEVSLCQKNKNPTFKRSKMNEAGIMLVDVVILHLYWRHREICRIAILAFSCLLFLLNGSATAKSLTDPDLSVAVEALIKYGSKPTKFSYPINRLMSEGAKLISVQFSDVFTVTYKKPGLGQLEFGCIVDGAPDKVLDHLDEQRWIIDSEGKNSLDWNAATSGRPMSAKEKKAYSYLIQSLVFTSLDIKLNMGNERPKDESTWRYISNTNFRELENLLGPASLKSIEWENLSPLKGSAQCDWKRFLYGDSFSYDTYAQGPGKHWEENASISIYPKQKPLPVEQRIIRLVIKPKVPQHDSSLDQSVEQFIDSMLKGNQKQFLRFVSKKKGVLIRPTTGIHTNKLYRIPYIRLVSDFKNPMGGYTYEFFVTGEFESFNEQVRDVKGNKWKNIGGRRYVPATASGTPRQWQASQFYIQWAKENNRWIVSEIGDPANSE